MINLSVVIPVYNGETDLPDLIECLRSQTYPANQVEYLLVDNNSQDNSVSIVQELAPSTTINIRSLSENNIQSSYAARNAGIRVATSDIIAFTDMDCRPEPQWLEELIKPFYNHNIGLVTGEIIALPSHNLLEKYADKQETLSQKHTLNNSFLPYGQTANLAIRRVIFEQVGLFRPYLTTGGDADMCWRIQQQTNYQLELASQAIVKHRHRSTLKSLKSQWRRYGESNRYLHELHGINLMKELTPSEYLYRLGRWILKELPLGTVKLLTGKAEIVDLISTPISLFNGNARFQGQQQAKLSEQAKLIERL
ncbi:MAG TPA: glycosyltransferase [Planktothrix sp. UBA8407]|jgi:Glycosyltransferases, probably involved in cell wall biogenesis|nr:glycosyltransferase [Planktothrix sp. UBA8402]HAO10742.1 glycosyltransferase [Planktothrix sp. UBA8407]HBK21636.1 glycosyltransferase [Planktothrix sp. UBA10369]